MNVDIKIKNLPETVTVNNILSIKDFYSFIGDEILHVNGEDINFVYFYND